MSGWQIYWLLKLDAIQTFFMLLGAFTALIGAIGAIGCYLDMDWNTHTYHLRHLTKKFTRGTFLGLFLFTIGVFIPNSRTMAAIQILPKILQGETIETVGKDAVDIYKLGVERLKELLEPKKESQ